MGVGRRVVPGNTDVTVAIVSGPDAWSQQIAGSMAIATNTFSPMAHGVHSTGGQGFTGDRGYGVNRWAGRLPYAVQNFMGPVDPIRNPRSRRLGIGAGVAGQPGLPNTGSDAGGLAPLAWMGYSSVGRTSLGT